jgi:cob(I)alamin adenosyltransferase
MSRGLLILVSYVEAALLVVVLSIGLNQVRKRLTIISNGLAELAGMLATVESQHLRSLMKWVADVNAPLQVIAGVLPGIASKAALVVRKATGG